MSVCIQLRKNVSKSKLEKCCLKYSPPLTHAHAHTHTRTISYTYFYNIYIHKH